MRFKTYFEKVNLNPMMYDLTTPEGRREYESDLKDAESFSNRPKKIETQRYSKQEPIQINCWSGCSPEHLERLTVFKNEDYRILDGRKSRSGVMWFAHQFQAGGEDYAKNHNQGILITHQLNCNAYYDEVSYQDGGKEIEPNREMSNKVHPHVESKFAILNNRVVETPNGWLFSEQGHLLCETTVKIMESNITKSQESS